MKVLSKLEPAPVFRYFEEICAIPHGSFETKAISDYLVDFAKEHGLDYRQDETNNVIIRKPASAGYEDAPTVMIQGHMDMVAEKEDWCRKDMSKEGLDLFVEGDLVGARGTTLGGDDGIAVAMALAILDDDSIDHGPLECVFTVDEEVGMTGARALDTSDLTAAYLINIDSEKDKVLTVSCAGSARILCRFPAAREAYDGEIMTITVDGLVGGHSGEEVHLGRANANILLGRALYEIGRATDIRLVNVQGGAKDNAIPRSAQAVIAVADREAAESVAAALAKAVRGEYMTPDPAINITLRKAETDLLPMTEDATKKISTFLFCCPCGVQNMSADVPGLVQTSLNLGRVFPEGDEIVCSLMIRSSVNSQKDEVLEKVSALCSMLGGQVVYGPSYSAWEYRKDSKLRAIMTLAFREVYGEEPSVEALHAGLECGILSGKMPELDCISIGPDLTEIHTPRERLHIASTLRIWELVLETLRRLR